MKRSLAVLYLLILVLAVPLSAQVDKAAIEAVALDQTQSPLPGVTVTVTRPETGFEAVQVTDTLGLARFPALNPGAYSVTFALEGFAPVAQQQVVLRVGGNAKVSVVMQAAASETISVTAEAPVVDVHKTDSSTNIVPEQIESLPVADRDFQRLAFIAPGVQRERGGFRFINGGPVVGAGGNASQATVLVNGVDLTDQVNGLARARFSQDAVREFRVINNRFDTEIGGSAGGALSIVTKSGTNAMTGSVFGFARDSALREKGALDLQKNDEYSRRQLGFTLGGPIVRDRTFYFASVEQINEENITLFRPGGAFAGQATDVDKPFDQTLVFGSVDANFGMQATGGLKGVYERYDEENFRVGGVAAPEYGQKLERRNWNLTGEHNWAISQSSSNDARIQYGTRRFFEPTNSNGVAEWFSSGNTLQTGGNILGDLLGDGSTWELRDTFHHSFSGAGSHQLKAGVSLQHVEERFVLDTYATGLFIYVTDTRQLPLAYAYGVGSSDVTTDTNIYGAFVEDSWRPLTNLVVNLGLRYDLDTNGNNSGFRHALVPDGREKDTNNFQPRFSFSYDMRGNGTSVLRGGAGLFTGRFLLVPALTELQANGESGRLLLTRINGALLGLPQLALDPNNPTTTGILSKPSITLLAEDLVAPESLQASVGYTMKLGSSRLFLDTEAVYVEGDNEIVIRDVNWRGNGVPGGRPNATWDQINTYTNDGHSKYTALVLSLNGNIRRNDLVTASVTFADKKNIADDFSPDFPTGYPNDPADMEAEYGRARGDERYRFVLSGVFHLPWAITAAPIFEYGSGQPWTERLGYDFNADGKNSDRPAGVGRNEEDGPEFKQLSLRLAKDFNVAANRLQVIAEVFNLTDETNYDVQSVVGGRYLSGPTAANANLPYVVNPRYGQFNATLPPREFQVGLRWMF